MNSRSLVGGLVAAALLLAAGLSYQADAQEAAPPVDPGRFKGKVAVFYLHGSLEDASVMIRDARFDRVHDRWFVTGTSPDVGADDWTRDAHAAVDWARVESFYVFTEEQFKEQVFEGPNAIGLNI